MSEWVVSERVQAGVVPQGTDCHLILVVMPYISGQRSGYNTQLFELVIGVDGGWQLGLHHSCLCVCASGVNRQKGV